MITLPSGIRVRTHSPHQPTKLVRSARSGEAQRFFSWRHLWEPRAGGAQTSKAKERENESSLILSEDESRDLPPKRKRPRTPPRPRASVVGDNERCSSGRTAGSRRKNPSQWKPGRNEPNRSPDRSAKKRLRDLPPWKPVRDELEQILRPQLYEDKYTASPFTQEIEDCPLPRRFKIPNIELYDASTDPEDHLSVFLTHMRLQTAADEIRYKTFPMFLKGRARLWFQGLAPESIRSFPELARQFVAQFVSSKTYSKNAAHLMAIRQKPDESLRNFMARFNTESLQIRDKDEKVVMAAFMNGFRAEELFYKLAEKSPGDLEELRTRAHAAANAEEAARLKRESDKEIGNRRGRENLPENKDGPAKKNVFDRLSKEKTPAQRPLPEKGYTPLTRPRTQILAVMEAEGLGERPPKMGTPRNKRNQDRYCALHRDVGHDTKGCWALRKEIEDLIQRGFLGRFVWPGRPGQEPGRTHRGDRGESQRHDRPERRDIPWTHSPDQDTQNLAGVINTIVGGPTRRNSHAARKNRGPLPEGDDSLKPLRMDDEITFGPRDAVLLASGNHEAIVIDVVTNNYRVKKVYVDQRSAVDILFYRVFRELDLEDGQLTPVRTPLVGFTGTPINSEGMITLMVMVVAQTTSLEPYISGEEARQLDTQDEIEEFPLGEERPDRVLRIGASLPSEEKEGLKVLLREYSQVFACTIEDMPEIPTNLAVHHLNVDPRFKPVKQKKRNFPPERNEVVKKEVGKLLESKIILEVYYPTWLTNPVLVKKEDQSWKMCVDFTDLNKAFPKDCFPLPRIDRLVDSTVGFDVLCFLDAFKGYHQIEMAEEHREKTSFITEEGTYYYRTMPFGLKNAGATYQCLVNKLF
ncbi:uncharacterized protein [Coffea arabica]|uniref:Reverse transcriptase domain-containing protein n=1 Tax=Coffea arabica TaxID=13443 RepID=A0ABM4WP94_COFAR